MPGPGASFQGANSAEINSAAVEATKPVLTVTHRSSEVRKPCPEQDALIAKKTIAESLRVRAARRIGRLDLDLRVIRNLVACRKRSTTRAMIHGLVSGQINGELGREPMVSTRIGKPDPMTKPSVTLDLDPPTVRPTWCLRIATGIMEVPVMQPDRVWEMVCDSLVFFRWTPMNVRGDDWPRREMLRRCWPVTPGYRPVAWAVI